VSGRKRGWARQAVRRVLGVVRRPGLLRPALIPLAWLLLAWHPGPVRAGYEIPFSGTTEGGGRASAGSYQLTYTIGQPSPVGLGSASTFQLTSGLAPLIADVAPPAIAHTAVEPVPPRTPVDVSAQIVDMRSGVDTVRVLFHEGGLFTFRERPMQLVSQNTYSAALPPSSVTERGIVYYIEARDNAGNVARYPKDAPDSLVNLTVYFTDFTSDELPAGAYRMVSIPGMPASGDPDSILVDDLGAYDRKSWRLGRWNPAQAECGERCYDEYPAVDGFAPGRAFWLISREARRFDFSGFSADISRPSTVPLAKGWNQIATPFGFATDWLSAKIGFGGNLYSIGDLHVVGPDTLFVEDNLIGYDGSYQGFRSELRPWEGYWVYNSGTEDIDLVVVPQGSVAGVAGTPDLGHLGTADFTLQLKVRSNEHPERVSFAGMSRQGGDAWDPLDLHEPPPMDDYLRAIFPRQGWGRHSGNYMADIRQTNNGGASWDFVVESSGSEHASLALASLGQMPQTWKVFLYDLDLGLRLDTASLPHNFDVEGSRRFVLMAGTDQFIAAEEASGGINLKPGIVSTVPNPFSEEVSITFFTPAKGPVEVSVYSVEGRLVNTVDRGVVDQGIHTVIWNGNSAAGRAASPGIYFLRLEAGHERIARKIMKIR